MSRNWCPAIAAKATDGPAPVPEAAIAPVPERPGSPGKHKGAVAASSGLMTSEHGRDVETRVHSSQVFSSRVAISVSQQLSGPSATDVSASMPTLTEISEGGLPLEPEVKTAPGVRYPAYWSLRDAAVKDGAKLPESVELSDVPVTTENAKELAAAPVFTRDAASLAIPRTLHGNQGVTELVGALDTNGSKLRRLVLDGNAAGLGTQGEPTAETLEALSKYLANPGASIQDLSLAECGLGPSGAAGISAALKVNSSLRTLNLRGNDIGVNDDAGVTAVAEVIQENKFLLRVDIGNNDFNGDAAKTIIDALGSSDTRVATPEPEPEPEPEEYTDELDPEDPQPEVKPGLPGQKPEDLEAAAEAAAAEEAAEEGEGDAGPADPEAEGEPAAEPNPATEEGEEQEEGEEEAEEAEPAVEEAPAAVEEDEEELDEEELEARREAAEEARREAEEAWRGEMEIHVWDPERQWAEYDEGVARRRVMQLHIDETTALKRDEILARQGAKDLQLARERLERERRSGWSHLQQLSLAGNPIGDVGAKALALALRHKVPLDEDELAAAEDKARTAAEEVRAKEREAVQAAYDAEVERITAEHQAAVDAAEEAGEDPPAEPELPDAPPEDDEPIGDIKVDAERRGVNTMTVLNLNGCSVGHRGLASLAATIRENCPSLVALQLGRNKFGVKRKTLPRPEEEEEDDDEEKPRQKVDVPGWVSPGVEALATALTNITVLDLSRNGMYPGTLRALAKGLATASQLRYLNLDGNNLGAPEPHATGTKPAIGEFLSSFRVPTCQLETLLLGYNRLSETMTQECADALANCRSVRHLGLAGNKIDTPTMRLIAGAYIGASSSGDGIGLQTLRFDGNALAGQAGGEALGELIKLCSGLKELSVRENLELGDAGFNAFALWLVNHRALRSLDIHRIGISTLGPLTTSLSSIAFLAHVDAADNPIPEDRARAFLNGCRMCPSLAHLALWTREFDVGSTLIDDLRELTRTCPTLVSVDIGMRLTDPFADAPTVDEPLDLFEQLEQELVNNRVAAALKGAAAQ